MYYHVFLVLPSFNVLPWNSRFIYQVFKNNDINLWYKKKKNPAHPKLCFSSWWSKKKKKKFFNPPLKNHYKW